MLKIVSKCQCVKSHSGIMWLSTQCAEQPHLIQTSCPPSPPPHCTKACAAAVSRPQPFVSLQITDRHRQLVSNLLRNRETADSNIVLKTVFYNEFLDSFQANKRNYLKLGNNRFLLKFLEPFKDEAQTALFKDPVRTAL